MKESNGQTLGKRIRDMDDLQLEEFISRIAKESGAAGATEALARVGLGDENAGADIKAIRGLLGGYRFISTTAKNGAVMGIGKVMYWAAILAALSLLAHFFPEATKKITERMIDP